MFSESETTRKHTNLKLDRVSASPEELLRITDICLIKVRALLFLSEKWHVSVYS